MNLQYPIVKRINYWFQHVIRHIALSITFRIIHYYQINLDEKEKCMNFWSNLHTELFKKCCKALDCNNIVTYEQYHKQMAVIGKRIRNEIHNRYA